MKTSALGFSLDGNVAGGKGPFVEPTMIDTILFNVERCERVHAENMSEEERTHLG